jgi:hypothetical protein
METSDKSVTTCTEAEPAEEEPVTSTPRDMGEAPKSGRTHTWTAEDTACDGADTKAARPASENKQLGDADRKSDPYRRSRPEPDAVRDVGYAEVTEAGP